jgi:hypothetical protein
MVLRTSSRGVVAAAIASSIAGMTPLASAQAQTAVAPEQARSTPIFAVDLERYSIALQPVIARPAPPAAREFRFSVTEPAAVFELPALNFGAVTTGARGPGFALRAAAACASDSCRDLAARLALRAEKDDWRVSIGARADLGDRFTPDFGEGAPDGWYVFVAADAQAMSFSFLGKREDSSSVQLEDMRLLGDAQAGVGKRLGGGDLAIGYVTREISHMGAERQENWVGLTYGWSG